MSIDRENGMRDDDTCDGSTAGPIRCSSCDLNEVCRLYGLIALEGRNRKPMGTLRTIRPGAHLYRAGAPAGHLYAVRQGLLKVVNVTAEGDEQLRSVAVPGEVLGLEAFSSGTYATDAVALQPVVCCELPLPLLEEQGMRVRELAAALIRLLSRATAPTLNHARGSIRTRIIDFLLDLSARLKQRGYDGREFTLGLSRQEIANLLDARIETVSRMMQRLHRERAIQIKGNSVTILQLSHAD
ncbi:Crp/Fnr family transcriptional regulator [Peristeroidobacter soli]|jgi:CRP/FNR family transcriptional regulator|uniref:Crp/Fnr family transcriptional regulator n=1 Tax=Peristeroidobacter soli TaxID=2497877 RepID=UPI00101C82EB|nr:cyclic nucleotide-binding domain-containing protein [Peristeroidobacter soli]